MEKIQAMSNTKDHTEKFVYEEVKWNIFTQSGDVFLVKEEGSGLYAMDIDASSVFSLSLVVMALKGNNRASSEVKYVLARNKEEDKYVLQITSALEQYSYVFRKRDIEQALNLLNFLRTINLKCGDLEKKLPIVGIYKPVKWTEYSPYDIVTVFDYSEYAFEKTPLIFANIEGRSGYVAIHDANPKNCKFYLHWNHLTTLAPINELGMKGIDEKWRVSYCLFPMNEELEELKKSIPEEVKFEETLSTYTAVDNAVKKGRQLVVFEDKVVDLSTFFERHPGTSQPLKAYIGREIGRWIYGSFMHQGAKHSHSPLAMDLLKRYTAGAIKTPLTEKIFSGLPKGAPQNNYNWTLQLQEGLNDIFTLLKLQNEEIQIAPQFSLINSYGRYVSIQSLDKKVTRNYFLVFTADEKINIAHTRLVKAIEENVSYVNEYKDINAIKYPSLTLVAKKKMDYSSWMCDEAPEGSEFHVRGPFGRGLELGKAHKGTVVALTAGMGMFGFLDLFWYLFRKNVNEYGKAQKKEFKVFENEAFAELSDPSFKFILMCSFKSLKDMPYCSLLQRASKIINTLGFKNIELVLRFSDETPEYWTTDYVKSKVPADASKLYVVGPEDFMRETTEQLNTLGHEHLKINYL